MSNRNKPTIVIIIIIIIYTYIDNYIYIAINIANITLNDHCIDGCIVILYREYMSIQIDPITRGKYTCYYNIQ